MKKLYWMLVLVGLGTACQQHTSPAEMKSTVAMKPAVNDASQVAGPAQAEQPLPLLFAASDTLTQPMRELLRTQDLSLLWQDIEQSDHPDRTSFQGFFGPEHYHFALVITQATRDAINPAVYHISGKTRYFQSRNVRSFTGSLTVRQIIDLSYPGFLAAMAQREEKAVDSLEGRTYTARARLQLREESTTNSGLFEGEGVLDFYIVPGQKPVYVGVFAFEGTDDRLPTRGGGVLLRGNRRNVSTGQVKPFIVSPDVSAIAPFVFKDFMLDERMGEINPKYAKLGWNDFWANDEWWADSPKPSLNL